MLRWKKKAAQSWYGEDGWLRYHIERQNSPASSLSTQYAIARGGIASDWLAKAATLQAAKDFAQIDAEKRENSARHS